MDDVTRVACTTGHLPVCAALQATGAWVKMKLGFASDGFSVVSPTGRPPSAPTRLRRFLRRSGSDTADIAQAPAKPDAQESDGFTLINRSHFENALVAIFADNTPEARRMKSDLEGVGSTAMIVPQIDIPEVWLRTYAPRLTCCIVGHDFADAGAAVDYCLRLRRIAPELVIALTLPDVEHHNFSAEHMPICEVTLRRPVSRVPLFLGIQAACDNRAVYECARGPLGTPDSTPRARLDA